VDPFQVEEDNFIAAQPTVKCPECSDIMLCKSGVRRGSSVRGCDADLGCGKGMPPREIRYVCGPCAMWFCLACGGKRATVAHTV
jgi:hypothetical protein